MQHIICNCGRILYIERYPVNAVSYAVMVFCNCGFEYIGETDNEGVDEAINAIQGIFDDEDPFMCGYEDAKEWMDHSISVPNAHLQCSEWQAGWDKAIGDSIRYTYVKLFGPSKSPAQKEHGYYY